MLNLDKLNVALLDRLDDLLCALGIEYNGDPSIQVRMACPLHCGDNRSSFVLNGPQSDRPGSWYCWSHSCHESFYGSVSGFVRGVLSRLELDWKNDGDEKFSFNETVKFCLEFLQKTKEEINLLEHSTRQKKEKAPSTGARWTRKVLQRAWTVPSPYFLGRNYAAATLERYCVGDCHELGKFFKRAVVPVFDGEDRAIAFSARSFLNKCHHCSLYHYGECPSTVYPSHNKWYHQDLKSSETLYNFHENKRFFASEKCAVIVESPGNALRAEDAGIPGFVATFGAKISAPQLELLVGAGVEKLVVIFDGDDAGISGANRIASKYGKDIQIIIPNLELPQGKDLGDFSSHLVRENIRKVFNRYGIRESFLTR